MVTPACIHRSLMRARSAASAAASWARSLTCERFDGVFDLDAAEHVAGLAQHADDVGEVVLALRVLGLRRRSAGASRPRRKQKIDGFTSSIASSFGGVGLLDDALDVAVGVAHDAPVARGVVDAGGEHGGRGVGEPVLGGERGERLRAQQRDVAVDDEQVVFTVEVVGERGEADAHRVAGAALHALLDELDRAGR